MFIEIGYTGECKSSGRKMRVFVSLSHGMDHAESEDEVALKMIEHGENVVLEFLIVGIVDQFEEIEILVLDHALIGCHVVIEISIDAELIDHKRHLSLLGRHQFVC